VIGLVRAAGFPGRRRGRGTGGASASSLFDDQHFLEKAPIQTDPVLAPARCRARMGAEDATRQAGMERAAESVLLSMREERRRRAGWRWCGCGGESQRRQCRIVRIVKADRMVRILIRILLQLSPGWRRIEGAPEKFGQIFKNAADNAELPNVGAVKGKAVSVCRDEYGACRTCGRERGFREVR
jgi:hypothetical protein